MTSGPNIHRVVGAVLLGLLAGACDGIWDIAHVGPVGPDADVEPLDGAGELGFGAPTQVTEVSSLADDGEPSLPSDMTEIYFKSNRSGGLGMFDIWRATRATATEAWSAPARVDKLSSADNETSPRIAPDGLTIWIQRNNTGASMTMVSTRPSRVDAWSDPVALTEFSSAIGDNQFSSTDPAHLVGYLTSEHASTTRPHLFRTTRASISELWGAPVEIPELMSTTGNNWTPWATPDGLAIVWASNRGGTIGSYDLWLATRATTNDAFGTAIRLTEINDEFAQTDPWISPDLRHIYFAGSMGADLEIYEASR